jgi:phosphoribosylanthranilate isomerase
MAGKARNVPLYEAVTRIKVCGITTLDDARLAAGLEAWALGMIFWPRSPRACPIEEGEQVGAALHGRLELVGVFVNASLDELVVTAERSNLTVLQLHGDEGPAFCAEAGQRTGCKVMKAMRVKNEAAVEALAQYHTDYHLLDTYVPGVPGGTGESFNWRLTRRHRGSVPVVLAGGLGPDNVRRAIQVARPFAVDTASATESSPGRKDEARLRAFFRAVQAADRQSAARFAGAL